jgi:hypothetical protein
MLKSNLLCALIAFGIALTISSSYAHGLLTTNMPMVMNNAISHSINK